MNTQTNSNQAAETLPTPQVKAVFEVTINGLTQVYWVRKTRVVLGTIESSDIRIEDAKVAPIHAVMEISFDEKENEKGCKARILDLASPGGVTVNGKKVVNQVLQSGDEIVLGKTKILFAFKTPKVLAPLPDQALLLVDANQVVPIFDHRTEEKSSLEVVYSWNQSILDVQHFTDAEEVTLGSESNPNFLVPALFSGGNTHTLATRTGDQWVVQLDPKMTGAMYINGTLYSLDEYRAEMKSAHQSGSIKLGKNDFLKLELGHVTFYVSQTSGPPLLKHHGGMVTDPFLMKTTLISLALTVLTLFTLAQMEPEIEEVEVPETIATILYHPEKYSVHQKIPEPKEKTPPVQAEKPKVKEVDFTKPKEEKKVAQTKSPQPGKKQTAQAQSKEGEGARAKGREGARGKNVTTQGKPKTAAKRPSPKAGEGRGGTESQVVDNGNVQMLKGATNKILDLLGGSGQKLGKDGSKIEGFSGFSTQGKGGLALEGSGKGGGGNADTLLGGLGKKGRGGGRVGTGLGAEGTGSGIVGGKTRVDLNIGGGEETVIVGSIDRDAIDAAIKAHRDEFRYCQERELNAGNPNLSGKVVTRFVIGASGRASNMSVASTSMNAPTVERCVLSVIGRIQFPRPGGGVPVNVTYPFTYDGSAKR